MILIFFDGVAGALACRQDDYQNGIKRPVNLLVPYGRISLCLNGLSRYCPIYKTLQ